MHFGALCVITEMSSSSLVLVRLNQSDPVVFLRQLLLDESFGPPEEPAGNLPHQGFDSLPPRS